MRASTTETSVWQHASQVRGRRRHTSQNMRAALAKGARIVSTLLMGTPGTTSTVVASPWRSIQSLRQRASYTWLLLHLTG